jgi:hypothetical protein
MFTIPFLLNDSAPIVFDHGAPPHAYAKIGLSAPFYKMKAVRQRPPYSSLCIDQGDVNPDTFSFAKHSRNSRFALLLLNFTKTTLWTAVGIIILSVPVRDKNISALRTF